MVEIIAAMLAVARPSQLRNLTRADLESLLRSDDSNARNATLLALAFIERPPVSRKTQEASSVNASVTPQPAIGRR